MGSTLKLFDLRRAPFQGSAHSKDSIRVPIHLHVTVVAVPLLFFFADWLRSGLHTAIVELILISLFIPVVLLRSIIHVRQIHRSQLGLRRLTIFPLCDLYKLMTIAENPRREMAVAIAGMFIPFLIPIGMAMLSFAFGHSLRLESTIALDEPQLWFAYSFWVTLIYCLVNLMPIFPFDGGLFFRAWLASKTSRMRATESTASISILIATLLVLADLFAVLHGFLFLLAIGIFLASQMELGETRFFQAMRHAPLDGGRSTPIYPIDRMVQPDQRPPEVNFTGFTWNPKLNYWIEWRDGQAIAANAILGEL
jgi:Zn-dependent protease